jgi:ribosomal protein S18 acetylase RimI-like enzyme
MIIRKIEDRDLNSIIKIHTQAFPDHFLTKLGPLFLKQYYRDVSKNKLGILLGIFQNEILIGICAATKHSANFNKKIILQNPFMYILFALYLIVTKPRYLYRLVKNINKVSFDGNDDGNYAELLSIAINPNIQGKGVGKLLLIALEDMLYQQSIYYLSLTTDSFNNDKALNFYIKSMGYTILYEFTAYPNRKMFRLIKKLN